MLASLLTHGHLDQLPLDAPGRAFFCCARFRGLGTVELVSCYFDVRGGLKANSSLIASLGARQRAHGMPTIFGGDFNLDPAVAQATLAAGTLGAVVHELSGMGTCGREEKWTDRDFFVVTGKLDQLGPHAELVLNVGIPQHRPVIMWNRCDCSHLC